jgi:ribonuclease-3
VWRVLSANPPSPPDSQARAAAEEIDEGAQAAADSALADLEVRLGSPFRDRALLATALTHPSYVNEHPEEVSESNERLEFLGDAALGFVVADELYADHPDVQEGLLTQWRAQLVCGPTLARVARELQLGSALRLGRGEHSTGGREREGNLERAYEAVVGAVQLDRGLEAVRSFVLETLADELELLGVDDDLLNAKGALQQLVQDAGQRPEYVVVSEEGPEHAIRYGVEVRLDGESVGAGAGPSKQQAEKAAAREALLALREAAAHAAAGEQ